MGNGCSAANQGNAAWLMVKKEEIEQAVRSHVNRVLLAAQIGLLPHQFDAFRKLCLDEFGNSGFGKDLEKIFHSNNHAERQGSGRNTLSKEGGAP
jgi:hypothetical protein